MNTGDKVRYISNVHKNYTNKFGKAFDFDLKYQILSIEFEDGIVITVFWNEIMV